MDIRTPTRLRKLLARETVRFRLMAVIGLSLLEVNDKEIKI